jgi:leucyl aminopeptidase (aminopeptidase T)
MAGDPRVEQYARLLVEDCVGVQPGWQVLVRSQPLAKPLIDAVSRESQVPAHELESWKRVFLEQGARGLKTRSDPEERDLTLARAKIGELMMRLELAEHLIEKRGLTDEWKRSRR